MATNEILQFAGTVGADNLITQADYLADAGNIRTIGNVPGIADDRLVNKALRQATLVAAALAQFTANNQANNILDTLTPATLAGYMQDAIASLSASGILSKSVAGGVDVTLSDTEAANSIIVFTGAITANINVIFPDSPGKWILKNDTTGNFMLTVKTAAGSSVEVNGAASVSAWSDGVGIHRGESVRPVVRVVNIASTSFPSPPVDICDIYKVTALATDVAITAPTSYTHSIAEGQGMVMRIKDDGTARALTWGAIYRPIGLTLPTTTIPGKTLYIGMFYNLTDTKWDVVGINQE